MRSSQINEDLSGLYKLEDSFSAGWMTAPPCKSCYTIESLLEVRDSPILMPVHPNSLPPSLHEQHTSPRPTVSLLAQISTITTGDPFNNQYHQAHMNKCGTGSCLLWVPARQRTYRAFSPFFHCRFHSVRPNWFLSGYGIEMLQILKRMLTVVYVKGDKMS